MIGLFYSFGIFFYSLGVQIAALFNTKAKKRVQGYRASVAYLKELPKTKKRVWFHCASLGEFEQGRPLIEKFQKEDEWEVVVSFFSPSGYEIIKKKELIDHQFYLLPDSKSNARKTVEFIKPDLVIFVKYEFWANHIFEIKRKAVPLYSISALFRNNQPYFKYRFFKGILHAFDRIFVQNQESFDLLETINVRHVEITGDTRFDRVVSGVENAQKVDLVEQFLGGEKAFLVGSSWGDDEEHIFPLINEVAFKQKVILAPHEIGEKHIQNILNGVNKSIIRYSDLEQKKDFSAQVLIIDNIGMLSNLYQYGSLAYVGGAFHGSLHNILEPAAFGLPVIFGPKFDKFPEGAYFIKHSIGKSISNSEELKRAYEETIENIDHLSLQVQQVVKENVGSSEKIMEYLRQRL